MKLTIGRAATLLAALTIVLSVVACAAPTGHTYSLKGVTLRPLPAEFSTRKALSYSGYRTGQGPGAGQYPSEAQIKEDLQLLEDQGFGLIRLYDCSTHGQRVLKVLKDNPGIDIKVMLGVWIAGPKATKDGVNQPEISRGVTLASQYQDLILAVSVGNETMVDWSGLAVPPSDMVAYIGQVRDQVSQPVTTDDNWEPFSFKHENGSAYATLPVAKAVDFLSIHTYPYADSQYKLWDWKQLETAEGPGRAVAMMDAALAYAKKNIRDVREALQANGLNTPIVIGETGWKDVGLKNRAHPVNAKMYFDRVMSWVYGAGKDSESPLACFYFEAFNEPWKQGDDNWGLFDKDRAPKYVVSGTGHTTAEALFAPDPAASTPVSENVLAIVTDSHKTDAKQTEGVWNAWENGTTADGVWVETGDSDDGGGMLEFTPKPLDWGWGMAYAMEDPLDLSGFESGHLKFLVKTTYAGALEVGFATGDVSERAGVDVYIKIASGQYGFNNNGSWTQVSIPLADLIPLAKPGYDMDSAAEIDLTRTYAPFTIADRYANTGTSGKPTSKITIDDIHWTKD